MAVIIGFATSVGGAFAGACATSVNWGYNPNVQRIYCIGNTIPTPNSFEKPTETLTIAVYQGTGPSGHDVTASTDCDDLSTISADVDPATCTESVEGVSGDWYVTSYSFSKDDPLLPGTESWTMTRWVDGADPAVSPAPGHFVRGVAEAQATEESSCGIVFNGSYSKLTGNTGSVSAGGVGRANSIIFGVADSVGGASLSAGNTGNGSASCPVTPLWV